MYVGMRGIVERANMLANRHCQHVGLVVAKIVPASAHRGQLCQRAAPPEVASLGATHPEINSVALKLSGALESSAWTIYGSSVCSESGGGYKRAIISSNLALEPMHKDGFQSQICVSPRPFRLMSTNPAISRAATCNCTMAVSRLPS